MGSVGCMDVLVLAKEVFGREVAYEEGCGGYVGEGGGIWSWG
jgi:hypothetical protein